MGSQITVKETYQAVNELSKTVARLEAWSSSTQASVDKLVEAMDDLKHRLTRLETKIEHLEKRQDERLGRFWDLAKLLIAAIVGGLMTLLIQYLMGRISN